MTTLEKNHKTALCSTIRTSRYSRKVVILLRDMSANLYKTDQEGVLVEMENVMEEELLNTFKEMLKDIDTSNPMETEQVLKSAIDYISNVEELSFIVPTHPGMDFVKRLYGWCAENINEEILLDFTTNRLMESGMIMIYKGHYYSYTLENLLDEYFQEHSLEKYFAVEEVMESTQDGE